MYEKTHKSISRINITKLETQSASTKTYRKWKVFCGIRPIEVMVLRIRKGKIGRSFLF